MLWGAGRSTLQPHKHLPLTLIGLLFSCCYPKKNLLSPTKSAGVCVCVCVMGTPETPGARQKQLDPRRPKWKECEESQVASGIKGFSSHIQAMAPGSLCWQGGPGAHQAWHWLSPVTL